MGAGLSNVALITDGRYSGGMFAALSSTTHQAPKSTQLMVHVQQVMVSLLVSVGPCFYKTFYDPRVTGSRKSSKFCTKNAIIIGHVVPEAQCGGPIAILKVRTTHPHFPMHTAK